MNQLDHLLSVPPFLTHPATGCGLKDESLPFTVRIVETPLDLAKAVQIRHSAYARHLPVFAESLLRPEPLDAEMMVVVLLAESKLNGAPLGTMRIQTNHYKPLTLEQSVELPDWLQGKVLAEATRLAVTDGRSGPIVKIALIKAFYEYCYRLGVEWMVVAGRAPLDRQYQQMLYEDVYPGQGFISLKHAGNMPHRIMALRVPDVEAKSRKANHSLYDYFFRTRHVDICTTLDDDLPAQVAGARRQPVELIEETPADRSILPFVANAKKIHNFFPKPAP